MLIGTTFEETEFLKCNKNNRLRLKDTFTTTMKAKGVLKRPDQVIYNMPISFKLKKHAIELGGVYMEAHWPENQILVAQLVGKGFLK